MSVLDELRKKADEKRAAEQQEAMTNEQLEQVYQSKILPKMQFIFDSFQEAIKYLNILEEPVRVDNYCKKYPQFGSLSQTNYRINTDGRIGLANYDRIMQINVTFFCEAKGDFSFRLESDPIIDREVEFLQNKRLVFDWKHIAPVGGASCALFTIQRKVPVAFRIEVDFKQSLLKVAIRNHENLRAFNKTYTPDQLDNEFLESLLSYFLRKDNRFAKEEGIPAELKKSIKESVQSKAASYQKEHGLITPPEETEPDTSKKNLIQSLFSKFQKKN